MAMGGWHENVMIDRVTRDNGDGSGQEAASWKQQKGLNCASQGLES